MMNNLPPYLQLIEADTLDTTHGLYSRSDALSKWLHEDHTRYTEDTFSEYFGLAVMGNESIKKGDNGWPGYFQPFLRMEGKECPGYGLAKVSSLRYWDKRSRETSQPLLRARYSDLIIDFSQALTGKGAHNEVRKRYINAVLELASTTTVDNWHQTQTLLRRALRHAGPLHDNSVWVSLGEAVLNVDEIMEADMGHLPTFSLKLLSNKKISLDEQTEQKILAKFKAALDLPQVGDTADFWRAHKALKCLAEHYKASTHRDTRLALIKKLEDFTVVHEDQSSGFRADHQWEIIESAYKQENDTDGVNRALAHRRRLQPKGLAEMKVHSFEIQFDRDAINAVVDRLCQGEPIDWLMSFADFHGLPNEYFDAYQSAKEKESSFLDIVSTVSLDEEGRTVSRYTAKDLDSTLKTIQDLAEFMQVHPLMFSFNIQRLRAQDWFNAEEVDQFLFKSNLIKVDKIIIEALNLYFKRYFSAFAHMAIPRIERMIRDECARLGAPTTRPNKVGGTDHRLLNELLDQPELLNTFDRQFVLYLRCLFIEKLGVNLRNDLLHGITPSETTSASIEPYAHRVFHALCAVALYIQLAREKAKAEAQPVSTE